MLFLTDLRFLLENPKEWPDSKGSFRFEDGVAITGVAEEKTGKNHKSIYVYECATLVFYFSPFKCDSEPRRKEELAFICRRESMQTEAQRQRKKKPKKTYHKASFHIIQSHLLFIIESVTFYLKSSKKTESLLHVHSRWTSSIISSSSSSCYMTGNHMSSGQSTYQDCLTERHV